MAIQTRTSHSQFKNNHSALRALYEVIPIWQANTIVVIFIDILNGNQRAAMNVKLSYFPHDMWCSLHMPMPRMRTPYARPSCFWALSSFTFISAKYFFSARLVSLEFKNNQIALRQQVLKLCHTRKTSENATRCNELQNILSIRSFLPH